MNYHFRPAKYSEASQVWQILKDAIKRRKKDGSNQWQDGYPNMEVVKSDIEKKIGFVLTQNDTVIGYTAVIINDEPDYINIEGRWLSDQDFIVYHRVAVSEKFLARITLIKSTLGRSIPIAKLLLTRDIKSGNLNFEYLNNLFKDSHHQKLPNIDYVLHAKSLGANAEKANSIEELEDLVEKFSIPEDRIDIIPLAAEIYELSLASLNCNVIENSFWSISDGLFKQILNRNL